MLPLALPFVAGSRSASGVASLPSGSAAGAGAEAGAHTVGRAAIARVKASATPSERRTVGVSGEKESIEARARAQLVAHKGRLRRLQVRVEVVVDLLASREHESLLL